LYAALFAVAVICIENYSYSNGYEIGHTFFEDGKKAYRCFCYLYDIQYKENLNDIEKKAFDYFE